MRHALNGWPPIGEPWHFYVLLFGGRLRKDATVMENSDGKRYILFVVLSVALLLANAWVMHWMNPPKPPAPALQQIAAKEGEKPADKKAVDKKAAENKVAEKNGADRKDTDKTDKNDKNKKVDKDADQKAAGTKIAAGPHPEGEGGKQPGEPAAQPKQPAKAPPGQPPPRQFGTLGSADPDSPFRLLVTWDSVGAAIQRIETNGPHLTDQENRSGYLGHLNAETDPRGGCIVRAVGQGTPAQLAGLQAPRLDDHGQRAEYDVIVKFAGAEIATADDLDEALAQTDPGQQVEIVVNRFAQGGSKPVVLTATLTREPMQVVRPEGADPLSFLLTLESIHQPKTEKGVDELPDGKLKIATDAAELPGVHMLTSPWRVVRDKNKPNEVAFEYDLRRDLPNEPLTVRKTFRLIEVDPAEITDPNAPAYHLEMHVEVVNHGAEPREVAYRLDGPTGLPIEGAWYASKISPNGLILPKPVGMRDVAVSFIRDGQSYPELVSLYSIVDDEEGKLHWQDQPLVYVGVDAHYFASVLIPRQKDPNEVRFSQVLPLRVGPVPAEKSKKKITNISCRLISEPVTLAAEGGAHTDEFQVFAGPKKPDLLAHYGLGSLVYYGWFGWVSKPMLAILHFFYGIVHNYGVAIIMLTVLVRLCMFPLSRKQALGAQKMQELQPEIKRIAEKYKGNMEARTKAQQELFAKHNYHPLSGCLPAFVQLPIFMGLYRSLAVDIELRGAPLISESIRWCSNLAAPDMLWKWQEYLPAFIAGDTGWLGPYFNVLPCVTIGLFIWQQKMFMPPPADEQAAMQQKVMRFMMIFMGVMFFKVASGLCLYFIASSTWGIAERKLLPKVVKPHSGESPPPPPPPKKRLPPVRPSGNGGGSSNGATGSKKSKHRGRR
jgi:YidC/Oxa1 family membrane protein insertase